MDTPLSSQWKALTFYQYHNNIDPNEYIVMYITQVYLYSTDYVVMYMAFPTNLKRPALE